VPGAIIFGCEGHELGAWERAFFARTQPLGFILFARNCDNPDQLRALIASLRDSVGRADAPVLIDQEGGRVQRLRPPHWRQVPAAARFGHLAERDPDRARQAVRLNARLLAAELAGLGITVNCAPVLDLRRPTTHDAIGDRAYGDDLASVAVLGRAFCDGLLEGGVLPVIKHLPGHGRAVVDSHHELPRVEATRAEAQEKLQKAVAALETIRLGLLYMQAGTGAVESLTVELDAAKSLSEDMEGLLEGHREGERILAERRRTGVFTLVTGTPERGPSE